MKSFLKSIQEDIRNADCRMAGLSWATLFNSATIDKYGYDCAYRCPYVKARKKAIKAKVCVMTYQLFLFIMNNPNYNKDAKGMPIFGQHNILFCDECHNIPDIVQNQYSPTIVESHWDKLESLYKGTTEQPTLFDNIDNDYDEDDVHSIYKCFSDLKKDLVDCWNVWICKDSRKDEDVECAHKYLIRKLIKRIYLRMTSKCLSLYLGGKIICVNGMIFVLL